VQQGLFDVWIKHLKHLGFTDSMVFDSRGSGAPRVSLTGTNVKRLLEHRHDLLSCKECGLGLGDDVLAAIDDLWTQFASIRETLVTLDQEQFNLGVKTFSDRVVTFARGGVTLFGPGFMTPSVRRLEDFVPMELSTLVQLNITYGALTEEGIEYGHWRRRQFLGSTSNGAFAGLHMHFLMHFACADGGKGNLKVRRLRTIARLLALGTAQFAKGEQSSALNAAARSSKYDVQRRTALAKETKAGSASADVKDSNPVASASRSSASNSGASNNSLSLTPASGEERKSVHSHSDRKSSTSVPAADCKMAAAESKDEREPENSIEVELLPSIPDPAKEAKCPPPAHCKHFVKLTIGTWQDTAWKCSVYYYHRLLRLTKGSNRLDIKFDSLLSIGTTTSGEVSFPLLNWLGWFIDLLSAEAECRAGPTGTAGSV